MTSLAFVTPVHGRISLTQICLRQLRRTCDALIEAGVEASAVVVFDPDGHDLSVLQPFENYGFGEVVSRYGFTSWKFNDGIEVACNPAITPSPADYVVPHGSDDFSDYRIFLEPLPPPDTIQGFKWLSIVNEDGTEIAATHWASEGGCGIRIIPRELIAPLGYRPCDEDRESGCDTSILLNLRRHHGERLKVKHMHLHDRQIVDWKSPESQLHSYRDVTSIRRSQPSCDPFTALAEFYPAEALEEMQAHYGVRVAA